ALFFAIASLGLPGLGNFIGEFLVLAGAFKVSIVLTVLTSLVLILAPVYSLIVIQKVFHGPFGQSHRLADYSRRELIAMALLMIGTLWLGLHPQPLLNMAAPSLLQAMQFLPG
ncbi:MAG: NADH-quinone oxidoreductase subunit M, partial [Methylosarcina sp.]